jgi:serine/threonine protein kinase
MSLDNYEIIKELGRGGMGAVFLANDKRLKRQVAIKVLKLSNSSGNRSVEEIVNNFKREAVAIANLSHNNIVCVYDIGNKENIHYIVMELIDGSPLSKILSHQQHPFNLETTLLIADEICDALSYIHKNKVIHRDIKPENIIYTAKGISKLTDFGIAKFVGDENLHVNDQPGSVKGTILYISPEQLQKPEVVDGRADMYSLAVSIYELLTGVLPFQGETPREVIMKILTDQPVPPSKIATDLLPHIDPVILKALSKDPDKRFANIDEFREELKAISDYRARFAIQGMKKSEAKKEKYYYSQISIESFEDLVTNAKILPEEGQLRLLYEIEMLFSKYIHEYREIIDKDSMNEAINKSVPTPVSDNKPAPPKPAGIKPPPPLSGRSAFIKSFNYIVPKVGSEGMEALKSLSVPMELIRFLSKVNGASTFMQIVEESYSLEKLPVVFNLLYNSASKNLLEINVNKQPEQPIVVGDMMVDLKVITQIQLDFSLKRKNQESNSSDSKLIGEILLEDGYITREKLLHVLKLQHWYRRLFA